MNRPRPRRVSLLGLPAAERENITHWFSRNSSRPTRYELATLLDDADLLIVDAADAASVQLVSVTEKLATSLFVGVVPPPGAVAFVSRPLEPDSLLRELDFLVAAPRSLAAAQLQAVAASRWKGEERRSVSSAAPPWAGRAPLALLVDDSEVALRFLETRLQRWGLVMERALSSGRAVELLAQREFDFVFLDVELGPHSDLDGLSLCRHIKRRHAKVVSTVVMVSAHHSEMDRVRGNLAGCDAYLGKPLDEVELQRLLLRQGLKPRTPA